jgi:small subunit ribosomal protein S17
MFRRKKKEEADAQSGAAEVSAGGVAENAAVSEPLAAVEDVNAAALAAEVKAAEVKTAGDGKNAPSTARARGNRVQKVGIVSSDKMQKTVVVRVDRLVLHPKYRRYVRRTSKFMAHDDLGSTTGDRVRIVETRPLSAHKRWRVVEIVQKAAK